MTNYTKKGFAYLTVKKEAFARIASGAQTEDYRDFSPFYVLRLMAHGTPKFAFFRCGYAARTPHCAFALKCVEVRQAGSPAHPEWGEPETQHFALSLGERVPCPCDRPQGIIEK